MIQRFLFEALKDGVEQFTADLTLFDQLFSEVYALSETEIAAIKTFWVNSSDDPHRGPPKVIHGYAPRDVEIPVYSIVLANEKEALMWLNDDIGQIEDEEDPNFGADQKGSIWNHQYDILVYHEHPDVTGYLYEIAKSIILASHEAFVERGLFDISVSGADLAPDPRYIPEHLFARKMSFSCSRLFDRVDRESRFGKAFAVSGIHIDKAGSPSDVGGVKTLVTIAEAEES